MVGAQRRDLLLETGTTGVDTLTDFSVARLRQLQSKGQGGTTVSLMTPYISTLSKPFTLVLAQCLLFTCRVSFG